MDPIQKKGVKKVTVLYPLPTIRENNKKADKKLRVAAYCRVSTGTNEQLVSYHNQIMHYENYIQARPDYEMAGIFADEGIPAQISKSEMLLIG